MKGQLKMKNSEIMKAYSLYQKGLSAKSICDVIGYTEHTVLDAIRKIDPSIIRSRAGFKPSWYENYFESINTEYKAYFLGFLMGDGNVTRRLQSQPCIRLQIFSKDSYILHILKEELNTTNMIEYYEKDNLSTLRVHSSKMASDLEKYGVIPNKTGKEKFPYMLIPEEFVNHF